LVIVVCCLPFAFPQSAPFSAFAVYPPWRAVSALKCAACYRSPEIGPSIMPFDGIRAVSMVERLGPP